MTDVAPPASSTDETQVSDANTQPGIRVVAQFIRDLSFENPRAPESLRASAAQPNIDLGVEMSARGRQDGLFEVDLKLSATAAVNGETNFHVELVYGGLFQIGGVSPQDMEAVLLVECPRFLFPFARRIIADLSTDGGFPPFLLDPIDFAGVYQAQRQQAAQNADAGVGHA